MCPVRESRRSSRAGPGISPGSSAPGRGRFIEVPRSFLASIATGSEGVPRLYFEGGPLSRRIFWLRLRRIHGLIQRLSPPGGTCLDFGGGGGVFLPSLAAHFTRVVSIDLETREARQVVSHFGLGNVELVAGDVATARLDAAPFGAIVAADVLEHFQDLAVPVARLREWLADDGLLYTSLPTESGFYRALRTILGVEPPPDHHHTGYQVERYLARTGFRRVLRRYVPLGIPIAPLFLVSVWRKGDAPGRLPAPA